MSAKTFTVTLPASALADIIAAHALPEYEFDITVGLWNKIEAALEVTDGHTVELTYDFEELLELRDAFEAIGRKRDHLTMLDAIIEAMEVEE